MKRLLAATDLSARSDLALHRAVSLAELHQADLHIVHVVDSDQRVEVVAHEVAQAEELLRNQLAGIDHRTPPSCASSVLTGDPFEEIVKAAEAGQADLVVLGAHRKRLLLDVFVGTTIERVMRTGHQPVLMVNAPADQPYRRIMAAVDLSDSSAHALREAKRVGLLNDAFLTVTHVFDPMAKGMMIYAGVEREKVEEYVAQEAAATRQALIAFIDDLDLGDVRYGIRLQEGQPLHAISKQVEIDNPDLLIVGTRGMTGMKRILLGSVADGLLRTSRCDVLAVPPAA
jgi:universal stress protein E